MAEFNVMLEGLNKITFLYTNHRGEVAQRSALPRFIRWEATEWHPAPQWIMEAFDNDKHAVRSFAMKDMSDVRDIPQ